MIVTRRLLATLIAVVLAISACSSDDEPPAAATSESSSAAPAGPFRILVTNDDGVAAPGIDALVRALVAEPNTEVTVVAPAADRTGTYGQTSPGPLTATQTTTASGHPATAVEGFPADSVLYGLATVLAEDPDLVMSGVNAGQNIGPLIDISGTVGAARAGAQQDIPALAVSAGLGDPIDFASAVDAAITWLRDYRSRLEREGTAGVVFNLNVPTCASGAIRGQVEVEPDLTASVGLAAAPADCTSTAPAASTDVAAFHDGFATLSSIDIKPG